MRYFQSQTLPSHEEILEGKGLVNWKFLCDLVTGFCCKLDLVATTLGSDYSWQLLSLKTLSGVYLACSLSKVMSYWILPCRDLLTNNCAIASTHLIQVSNSP